MSFILQLIAFVFFIVDSNDIKKGFSFYSDEIVPKKDSNFVSFCVMPIEFQYLWALSSDIAKTMQPNTKSKVLSI